VLFNVAAQSDSLIKLDVSGNNIGDLAASAISDAIIENRRITELNLSRNGQVSPNQDFHCMK